MDTIIVISIILAMITRSVWMEMLRDVNRGYFWNYSPEPVSFPIITHLKMNPRKYKHSTTKTGWIQHACHPGILLFLKKCDSKSRDSFDFRLP